MEYTSRSVRSRPGLTQEEALASLQSHPEFRAGTKIASIRRRGKVWVADLLEPKVAGPFPPSDDLSSDDSGSAPAPSDESSSESAPSSDSPDSSSSDDSSSDSSSPDGPPSDDGESGPPKPKGEEGGKGGVETQILHTLQQILHALQGGPVGEGIGGPDDLGPDLGGPPAPHSPHGGPGGGLSPAGPPKPGAAGIGAKLKPGEVKNAPGVTPVGAPAFASTRQANPLGPGPSVPPGAAPTGPGAAPSPQGPCPQCGAPQPCNCGYGGGGAVPGAPAPGPVLGRVATFTASRPANVNIKQAKAELDATYGPHGYTVKQIKREGNVLRALLSRR